MITFTQLEQLIKIKENQTLSKAATKLHISQPALSRSMMKLEDDLGIKLFEHYKNKITLNEKGELAVKHAIKLLKERDIMINELINNKKISIASLSPASLWDLVPILKDIYNIDIESHIVAKENLLDEKYDLIITNEYINNDKYICIPYLDEDLYLSLPLNHKLSSKKEVLFKDLENETMLLYSNIGIWSDIHKETLPLTRFLIQNERDTFNEVVKSSMLPSFTTNLSIKREGKIKNRIIIPFNEDKAHMTYYIVLLKKNKNKYIKLIEYINNYYDY